MLLKDIDWKKIFCLILTVHETAGIVIFKLLFLPTESKLYWFIFEFDDFSGFVNEQQQNWELTPSI